MKIQPVVDVDTQPPVSVLVRPEPAKPAVLKSRIKRLFDRQFHSVLKTSSSAAVEKPISGAAVAGGGGDEGGTTEIEPSSVCLDKMVQNYLEESNETKPLRGRNRCNCFNRNGNDSSDDELEFFGGGSFNSSESNNHNNGSSFDASDSLKSLIPCSSVTERNLLADTSMIIDKNKNTHKQKHDLRQIVVDGLISRGYDASICKSKWDKSSSCPAGEYEYVDVIVEGERVLIDVDFRSEFEIARSTGAYKAILQLLPFIFVGKQDRLGQLVTVLSEAAKQSLNKKGMHFPPWRKAEYMRAKWLTPSFTRLNDNVLKADADDANVINENKVALASEECGELELIFLEKTTLVDGSLGSSSLEKGSGDKEGETAEWKPPVVKPKGTERGAQMVTGLASLLKERP